MITDVLHLVEQLRLRYGHLFGSKKKRTSDQLLGAQKRKAEHTATQLSRSASMAVIARAVLIPPSHFRGERLDALIFFVLSEL